MVLAASSSTLMLSLSLGKEDSALSYSYLSFLTLEAVVEVVFVCLAGFLATKTGLLPASAQKHISRLNVDLFTPALIFSKLAPSLSFRKLIEIAIIPIFYAITTGVSYICAKITSRCLRLNKRESNFVTAMSVFGNSNSLPVSLTVALSYTLPVLAWEDLDDDTPDKVASRGILYLLIFQQLGQVLRWSWGYNTLLCKPTPSDLPLPQFQIDEESQLQQHQHQNDQNRLSSHSSSTTISSTSDLSASNRNNLSRLSMQTAVGNEIINYTGPKDKQLHSNSQIEFEVDDHQNNNELENENADDMLLLHPSISNSSLQPTLLTLIKNKSISCFNSFMSFMNPPLWAMLASVMIASISPLQREFFENNGFIQHTLSSAIKQLGGVSIPLILVILGSNLVPEVGKIKSQNYKKIVFGSLISRMILPSLILLPLIAICVRYIPISILDDPIFLLVSFILTISPPAIQLSQICQLNEIFEQEMAGVLFWGYVVLTLPITILIVVSSLEVLDWAKSAQLGH